MYETSKVRESVTRLQNKGFSVLLDEVSGVPHPQALQRYALADSAIDKMHAGWYGVFSLECIGMGVPSIAGISENLRALNPPVLPIGPEGLDATIEPLLVDQGLRREITRRLFQIGKALHPSGRFASRVHHVYEKLLEDAGAGAGELQGGVLC